MPRGIPKNKAKVTPPEPIKSDPVPVKVETVKEAPRKLEGHAIHIVKPDMGGINEPNHYCVTCSHAKDTHYGPNKDAKPWCNVTQCQCPEYK